MLLKSQMQVLIVTQWLYGGTAMRVITAGNEFNPSTPEGRGLAFLIAVFGYAVFGYVTATFATFFIGRDAEEKDAPLVGAIPYLKSCGR